MRIIENYAVPATRMTRNTSYELLSAAKKKRHVMQFDDLDELERMRNTLLRYRRNHPEFSDIRIRMISQDAVIMLERVVPAL